MGPNPFTLSSPFGGAVGAGWSSPVARQAHNLKVAGSNPAPATNKKAPPRAGLFCIRGSPFARRAPGCYSAPAMLHSPFLQGEIPNMASNPTPTGPTSSLVERVKNILLHPKEEWARIDAEPATV